MTKHELPTGFTPKLVRKLAGLEDGTYTTHFSDPDPKLGANSVMGFIQTKGSIPKTLFATAPAFGTYLAADHYIKNLITWARTEIENLPAPKRKKKC